MNYADKELQIKTSANRLELIIEDETAFIDTKLSHNKLFLLHTEVPATLNGKGIGSALVEKAFHYAKDNQYKIIPICKFVQAYLQKNPEWKDLVAPDTDRFLNK